VATHWGIDGQPNGWSSRLSAALLMPVLALVLWGVLRALPAIDPRRANYAKFQGTYDLVVNAILTFLVALHAWVLGTALGWPMPSMQRLMPVSMGALFLVLGNFLPRARPNWWFGIRTPWTLSSDTVWARTHRIGGYLMSVAGLACVLAVFLPPAWSLGVIVVAVSVSSLGSVVYSYFAWKQEQP
jgi:uncharacterized membrane protein